MEMEGGTMRFIVSCSVLAAAVLALLTGSAVAQAPVPPNLKERFAAFDKNKDGVIDRAEFQAWMTDVFYQEDRGHKGHLTHEDVAAVMSLEKFKAHDPSGDGTITLREFINALFQDFAAADTTQRGALTLEEIAAYTRENRR